LVALQVNLIRCIGREPPNLPRVRPHRCTELGYQLRENREPGQILQEEDVGLLPHRAHLRGGHLIGNRRQLSLKLAAEGFGEGLSHDGHSIAADCLENWAQIEFCEQDAGHPALPSSLVLP